MKKNAELQTPQGKWKWLFAFMVTTLFLLSLYGVHNDNITKRRLQQANTDLFTALTQKTEELNRANKDLETITTYFHLLAEYSHSKEKLEYHLNSFNTKWKTLQAGLEEPYLNNLDLLLQDANNIIKTLHELNNHVQNNKQTFQRIQQYHQIQQNLNTILQDAETDLQTATKLIEQRKKEVNKNALAPIRY